MNQVVNGCMMCVMKYGGQVKARKNCRFFHSKCTCQNCSHETIQNYRKEFSKLSSREKDYFHSSINEGMYVSFDEK